METAPQQNEALTLVSKALALLKPPDGLDWKRYEDAVVLLEQAIDKLSIWGT